MEGLYRAPAFRLANAESRAALYRWWIRDPLLGLKDWLPHQAIRALPTDMASDLGAWLARGQSAKRPGPSDKARALLRQLRPAASDAEIEALVAAHWRHLGRCLAEFSVLHRLWTERRIEIVGAEHLATDRPLVVAALHVGSWEAVHVGLSGHGVAYHGIYQRLPNRFRMRIAIAARDRSRSAVQPRLALPLHPTLGAVFEAHRLLESRETALLYYIDEYWEGRVHAPALGRPLKIDGNIARAVRLASATGAAVVPCYALRIGEAARFRLTFLPPVIPGPPGRGRSGILDDIAALDAVIDPVVRAHPEQWMMAHVFRSDR